MIKILLVEDDNNKRRLILNAAMEVEGVTLECIDNAGSVFEAKKLISEKRYDLVILDINLPKRPENLPEVGAGLDVLRFIKNNSKAVVPRSLFGLTAYDDAMLAAEEDFEFPLWKLGRFSFSDDSWKQPLKDALVFLSEQKIPPYQNDGVTYHTDLGIFVALEEELQSVLSLDANWILVNVPYDSSPYYQGKFKTDKGVLTVVATVAPTMGMPSAGVCSSKLIHNFRPEYLAITGICAGVRGKSDLGDVLIADPCFDWGSGKWLRDTESSELKFRPASYQWRLDETIRADLRKCSSDGSLLRIYQSYIGQRPPNPPKLLIDAMASGAAVLQASQLMDDVRQIHKNLVGIEMESYAVYTAAQLSAEPRPKCISIKSVCDFGDEAKSDDVHKFAAYVSANFLFHFATTYLVKETI